MEDSFWFFKI